jgi:uncharacterized protein Yka (UPF0111/DUF47 family)
MTTKGDVLQQLGETGVLLPDLINLGLAANDRLKYYLTLLQSGEAHAIQPDRTTSNLRVEREASGVLDSSFDDVVGSARLAGDGMLALVAARRIRAAIFDDLAHMLAPLQAQDDGQPAGRPYEERFRALDMALDGWSDDQIPLRDIETITRPGDGECDTVHQLVMDLHREINRLQASVARESVDGAKAYALEPGDQELVRAFMSGLNETAPLKFDHPGLGTTATRTPRHLCIQNDLGTTDVHVVIVNIAGLTATILYTDLHRRRAQFFRDMLSGWNVAWHEAAAAGGDYELSIGAYTAPDLATLEKYLAHVGFRLVFLIDWNKARKRLARFVRRKDAVGILLWAAENNVGHRAFLEAGDIGLLYPALERGARAQLHVGMRLDEVLGGDVARSFLCAALRIASEGLRAGRTRRLIQDEIEAELLTHLQTSERSMLAIAAEHAALLTMLADRLRRTLARASRRDAHLEAERSAELAKTLETRADELVSRFHHAQEHCSGDTLARLASEADRVADSLEAAAFLLALIPKDIDVSGLLPLSSLADLVSRSAREYVRCLECARELPREPVRAEVEEVLVSVDRILQLQHGADTAGRGAKAQLLQHSTDFRQLHVLSEIAQALENAAGSLGACSLILREYALRGVLVTP